MAANPKPESARGATRTRFAMAAASSREATYQNHPRAAKKRAKTFDRVGNNFVAHITWLLAF
jgi:hypothetical protein